MKQPLVLAVLLWSSTPLVAHPLLAQRTVAADERAPTRNRDAELLLARRVSVDVNNVSLQRAIDAVAASAHVLIQYRERTVDAYRTPVTLHLNDVSLNVALEHMLAGTALRVVADGPTQLSVVDDAAAVGAEPGTITGTVIDAQSKLPLANVAITLDDEKKGVTTAQDGTFRMTGVASGNHRVTARLLGRTRRVQSVVLREEQPVRVDFALESSTNQLDQVVVTGTVIATEMKAVPNAITVITAKDIEQRGITKIDQLFRGEIPGLFAVNMGSSPGALLDEVTMFSRGATALSPVSVGNSAQLTNPIKTYVDGVELADPKYLSQIDPKSIERIEILTGPQASTIYGSNAINGVMQIFTKRGETSHPQLTLNLLSGWVENNFSSARTPQHDYSAQLSGIEGRFSYNAGGAWNYMGPWTPTKQMARTSVFDGNRIELPTQVGRISADLTLRSAVTQTRQHGDVSQILTNYRDTGWYTIFGAKGLSVPTVYALTGQTLGLVIGYAPTSWWSHEFGIGEDREDLDSRTTARGYISSSDTTLQLIQNRTDRRSYRYTTTAQTAITSLMSATVTLGADAWQNLTSLMTVRPQTLTGTLTGTTSISRVPDHNAGGFVQTQLGVNDRLFLTYGLRAEWNPNYGAEAQPNYAPRSGVAYAQEFGPLTTKLRGSYGRSTRPPVRGQKLRQTITEAGNGSLVQYYGDFDNTIANPELGPEHQQGGEVGAELYFGTRGSLVVTRYNQIVDGLISTPKVDSVRSFTPCQSVGCSANIYDTDGYGYYYQVQYLNVGSIRNQGWELQGSVNTGPFTTRGTYSWTKSRTIGVNAKYQALFAGNAQYSPGATFRYVPEHTWALGVTYAHAATTVGLNITGVGQVMNLQDAFYLQHLNKDFIRLWQNAFNVSAPFGRYVSGNRPYALADLVTSRRFGSQIEGVFQVQNLTDRYANDSYAGYATLGRQVKAGFRIQAD